MRKHAATAVRRAPFFLAFVFALLLHAPVEGAFVYVIVGQGCEITQSCSDPGVLIVDTELATVVTRIPLPVGTAPAGIAISPNGSRLYVSLRPVAGGSSQIAVIDALRHTLLGSVPVAVSGQLAVSRDSSRVFILVSDGSGIHVDVFNPALNAITGTTPIGGTILGGIAASPTADRLFVATSSSSPPTRTSTLFELDTTTGAKLREVPVTGLTDTPSLHISRDGLRLYVTLERIGFTPQGGATYLYDAQALTFVRSLIDLRFVRRAAEAAGRRRAYIVGPEEVSGRLYVRDIDTAAAVTDVGAAGISDVVVARDEARAYFITRAESINGIPISFNTLYAFDLATNAVVSNMSLPRLPGPITTSPPGAPICSYGVSTTLSPWTVNGGTTTINLTTGCTWQASSDATWARLSASQGDGSTALTLTVDPNSSIANRSAKLTIGGRIVTVSQAGFAATPAFGNLDAPIDGTTGVSGALAVGGWALDDVGVTRVRIVRDAVAGEAGGQVYIGDATFVEGARPDVQAAFPALPNSGRAGWGLLILTNMLPNGGNGAYRLHVYADDAEGHSTLLGSRTLSASNATATVPFGTIDTPAPGETVSGTAANFGWALTPQPNEIAGDGSTIDVYIDNVLVGHPTYGLFRADIAALFPGYRNSNGAIGYFPIDTTKYPNGLHTLAWVVRDSAGQAVGIGSRFFRIQNP